MAPDQPFIDQSRRPPLSLSIAKHGEFGLRELRFGTSLVCIRVTDDSGAETIYELEIGVPPRSSGNMDDFDKPHGEFNLNDIVTKLLPRMTFTVRNTSQKAAQAATYMITGDAADQVILNNLTLEDLAMNRLGKINFTVASGGTAVGSYNISVKVLATTPIPPLPSGARLDMTNYGDLYSFEVFKLLELLQFSLSSPGKPRKKGHHRPKIGAGVIQYNIRPKLHSE